MTVGEVNPVNSTRLETDNAIVTISPSASATGINNLVGSFSYFSR